MEFADKARRIFRSLSNDVNLSCTIQSITLLSIHNPQAYIGRLQHHRKHVLCYHCSPPHLINAS